jgi:hypothetical protein
VPLVLVTFTSTSPHLSAPGEDTFFGALLNDPAGLLEGAGKRGRHVKLWPDRALDSHALGQLVDVAYADIKARLRT